MPWNSLTKGAALLLTTPPLPTMDNQSPKNEVDAGNVVNPMHPVRTDAIRRWATNVARERNTSSNVSDVNCGVRCTDVNPSAQHMSIGEPSTPNEIEAMTICSSEDAEEIKDLLNRTAHLSNLATSHVYSPEPAHVHPSASPYDYAAASPYDYAAASPYNYAAASPYDYAAASPYNYAPETQYIRFPGSRFPGSLVLPKITRKTSMFSGASNVTVSGGTFTNCGGSVSVTYASDGGRTIKNIDSFGNVTVTQTIVNRERGRTSGNHENQTHIVRSVPQSRVMYVDVLLLATTLALCGLAPLVQGPSSWIFSMTESVLRSPYLSIYSPRFQGRSYFPSQ